MLDFEYDELAENDPLLLQAEPMRPIRFEYLTTTRDLAIQTDMLERLGLVHVFVGRNLFAVNECDSNSLRLTATEQLDAEGIQRPSEATITKRAAQLLTKTVREQAAGTLRSAINDVPNAVDLLAQQMRAQADADLAAHGIDMKARLAHAVAEHEAA